MYEYKLKSIKRVYDGDAITCSIDLGFGITAQEKFRLADIDAPELRGDELHKGRESRRFLKEKLEHALQNDIPIIVKTTKDKRKGSYGRYLATFFIQDKSVNNQMVRAGFAQFSNPKRIINVPNKQILNSHIK